MLLGLQRLFRPSAFRVCYPGHAKLRSSLKGRPFSDKSYTGNEGGEAFVSVQHLGTACVDVVLVLANPCQNQYVRRSKLKTVK